LLPPPRHERHAAIILFSFRRCIPWLLLILLQVKSQPPVPALRLVVVTNLIAEAALLVFHLTPLWLAAQIRRWKAAGRPGPIKQAGNPALHIPSCSKLDRLKHGSKSSSLSSSEAEGFAAGALADVEQLPKVHYEQKAVHHDQQQQQSVPQPGEQQAPSEQPPSLQPTGQPQQQQQQDVQQQQAAQAARNPQVTRTQTTVRPPVALVRGLTRRVERWEEKRPKVGRRLALAAITAGFMGCCSLQILAPGFVDVSIVSAAGF
jgi:hypothetical protein